MKVIAIDYDETYTADKELFDMFIEQAHKRGHLCVCVTFRYENMPINEDIGIEVFYTCGRNKAEFMAECGPLPDIWIDDMPHLIGKFAI